MDTFLVRLKPYDPRRGHVLRRYAHRGIRFLVEHGWYRVDREVADHLRTARQVDADPHSLLAFDVCTEDEARQIDTTEQARERATRATDDIPRSTPRAPAASDVAPGGGPLTAPAASAASSGGPPARADEMGGSSATLTDERAGMRRPRRDKE